MRNEYGKAGGRSAVMFFFALVLALLPGVAHPALNIKAEFMGGTGVGAAARSPYRYIRVTVDNPAAHKVTYEMKISSYPGQGIRTLTGQALDSGASRVYHLPLLDGPIYGMNLICPDSDGERGTGGVNFNEAKFFLNIAPVAGWASEKAMQDFTKQLLALNAEFARVAGRASTPTTNFVAQTEPGQLPDNWLCYSPYIAVFASDSAYKEMPAEARTALLRWVDAGGSLTIYGAAEPRTEPRLLGTIQYQAQSPIDQISGGTSIPRNWLADNQPWQNFWGQNGGDFPYLIRESNAGTIGGLILATLFCIIAGPVNYAYWQRRKKIHMLLLSLPALSIGFCLLITVYFFASKGFTRKGGSFCVTVLDEANNNAVTCSRHMLFSGLFPLGGFSFDKEAAFYPLQQPDSRSSFQIDLSKSQRLTSGLFIPSVPFHYFTALPGTTREHLVFEAGGAAVTNGFESPLDGVVVVRGGKVLTTGKLAPGARATLTELTGEEAGAVWKRYLTGNENNYLQGAGRELYEPITRSPKGYYGVVFAAGGQAAEQPGVRIAGQSRHVLFSALH